MLYSVLHTCFLLIVGTTGFFLSKAFSNSIVYALFGACFSLALGVGVIFAEKKLREAHLRTIISGVLGLIVGLLIANFVSYSFFPRFLSSALVPGSKHASFFFQLFVNGIFSFLGLSVGIQRGERFDPKSILDNFKKGSPTEKYKIFDTSVIIDGRIADICDTGFLEGVLVIPKFVVIELQHIADSSDGLKRNRGRRGLEILHRIQKQGNVEVRLIDKDYPDIHEVDSKLVELAKETGGELVTNDFNLNKVAGLYGVQVLNVNELANALKPMVLPGEVMEVFVQREGKEQTQGVAYLDDGTMVVVDNARKSIGKDVEIAITSVLQTDKGRMIFGKLKGNDTNGFPYQYHNPSS